MLIGTDRAYRDLAPKLIEKPGAEANVLFHLAAVLAWESEYDATCRWIRSPVDQTEPFNPRVNWPRGSVASWPQPPRASAASTYLRDAPKGHSLTGR